jgi:hypothetical protein
VDNILPEGARHAPATLRNRDAIYAVLENIYAAPCGILEIASGSGEHGAYFTQKQPGWRWQPSDADPQALTSIEAWAAQPGVSINAPLHIDVCAPSAQHAQDSSSLYDHGFCANMIHIAPPEATDGLLKTISLAIKTHGFFVLYGPFKMGGVHTAPSNEAFDQSLKSRDPSWGIRDLGDVVDLARRHQLIHVKTHPMPANNLCVCFRKTDRTPHGQQIAAL